MSKLYRESNLRLASNRVAMHPTEARSRGLEEGARAILETDNGQRRVEVTLDPGIPPGVVLAATPAVQAKVVRV
jgi:anaerobic selenocysteine-containing dehydrogenase